MKAFQRDLWGMGPWARFKKRAAPGDDIVSLLLSARDETGDALSAQEVAEQLLSFVVAGHETTATTLAWAMDQLHRDPALLTKLRAELDALGPSPAPDALVKLPLLQAVCDETLRLYPPVPMVTRKLAKELTLKGYALPVGTNVAVAGYMAHHREEVFAEAAAFKPERFVGRTYTPFEFMPYGGGARRCLGAAFAGYELKVVLATLLAAGTYRLEEPKPVGRAFRIGTFGPRRASACASRPLQLEPARRQEGRELRVTAHQRPVDEHHREGGEARPELEREAPLPLRQVAAVLEVGEAHARVVEGLASLLHHGVLRHADDHHAVAGHGGGHLLHDVAVEARDAVAGGGGDLLGREGEAFHGGRSTRPSRAAPAALSL